MLRTPFRLVPLVLIALLSAYSAPAGRSSMAADANFFLARCC